MLHLTDKWVWDFWIVADAGLWHAFFLQADRSLGDPELRHWNVSIGRATSIDLLTWTYHGTVLRPGPGPSFDDGTTWTGSIVRHAGQWWMFYTGNCLADNNTKQRIGLATSPDLATWTKHGTEALFDLDSRFYEDFDRDRWQDRSWRDPFVVADPTGAGWRMYFTARVPTGAADAAGVIGMARSSDLLTWTAAPPVAAPEFSGELEVPQLIALGGRWYLIFCVAKERLAKSWLSRHPGYKPSTGSHAFVADHPDGPWTLLDGPFFAGDEAGSLYAGRIIETGKGPVFMAFRNRDAQGAFIGDLSDPIPVQVRPDGTLRLDGEDGQGGPPGGWPVPSP